MQFSDNVKLEKSEDGGYIVKVKGYDMDELFTKHKGFLNVTVKRPQTKGTSEQNRFFHALLNEFWKTGKHSAPEWVTTCDLFKLWLKSEYGPCHDFEKGGRLYRIPLSWEDYSKEQRTELIEAVLSDIHQSGAYTESEKIREIIKGAEDNSLIRCGRG